MTLGAILTEFIIVHISVARGAIGVADAFIYREFLAVACFSFMAFDAFHFLVLAL